MTRIFVYGMLLCRDYVENAVGGEVIGPARFEGHRLAFDGLATVIPGQADDAVYGTVIQVDAAGLRRLDRTEGVLPQDPGSSAGLYRRETVTVYLLPDVGEEIVQLYIYNRYGRSARKYPPTQYYFNTIWRGYDEYRLPFYGLVRAIEEVTSGAEKTRA